MKRWFPDSALQRMGSRDYTLLRQAPTELRPKCKVWFFVPTTPQSQPLIPSTSRTITVQNDVLVPPKRPGLRSGDEEPLQ